MTRALAILVALAAVGATGWRAVDNLTSGACTPISIDQSDMETPTP